MHATLSRGQRPASWYLTVCILELYKPAINNVLQARIFPNPSYYYIFVDNIPLCLHSQHCWCHDYSLKPASPSCFHVFPNSSNAPEEKNLFDFFRLASFFIHLHRYHHCTYINSKQTFKSSCVICWWCLFINDRCQTVLSADGSDSCP